VTSTLSRDRDHGDGEARGVTFTSSVRLSGVVDCETRLRRETYRGLVGTLALADCLWPIMDTQRVVALGY
jgi:hypothetical protein